MVLYGYLAGCFFLGPYRLVTSCGNSRHYCDSEFLLNTTGVFHDFNIRINPHQTTKISEGIELFGYRFRICIDPTGSRDLPVVILPSCGQCSLRWSGQTWMHSSSPLGPVSLSDCSSSPVQCSLKGHVWDNSVFFSTMLGR